MLLLVGSENGLFQLSNEDVFVLAIGLAQPILSIGQLILSIHRYRHSDKENRKLISIYWVLISIHISIGIIATLLTHLNNSFNFIVWYFSAWFILLFYWIIVYNIKQQSNEK